MTGEDETVSFVFVSGNPGLDLAGTLKWRESQPEELLVTADDVAAWILEAGILSASPRASRHDVVETRSLREAIYAVAQRSMFGRLPDSTDASVLNRHASEQPPAIKLVHGSLRRTGTVSQALADVARSFLLLIGTPDVVIKSCSRRECTRIFVDKSPGSRRSWCGMAECGNRVKQAAYRARQKL